MTIAKPASKKYRVVSGSVEVLATDSLEDAVASARAEAAKHKGTVSIMGEGVNEVAHAETDGRVIVNPL